MSAQDGQKGSDLSPFKKFLREYGAFVNLAIGAGAFVVALVNKVDLAAAFLYTSIILFILFGVRKYLSGEWTLPNDATS